MYGAPGYSGQCGFCAFGGRADYRGGSGEGSVQLTIYCALYPEAQEIIQTFQLKKEHGRTHFQVFTDETGTLRLVITGIGAIAAASAVVEISTLFPPKETDLLLNFGTCAAAEGIPVGEVLLCNKLTEQCSGRIFYPDMLYRHPFGEAEMVSCGKVMSREEISRGELSQEAGERILYDMEASAIYQAASYSYGPHQMLFLKVVSDHGGESSNTIRENSVDMRQNLPVIIRNSTSKVCSYISFLRECCQTEAAQNQGKSGQHQQVKEDAAVLGEQLHCSVVMRGELEQLLWYWKLTGVDYEEMVSDFCRKGRLPAKDKREGKKILDELKGHLF